MLERPYITLRKFFRKNNLEAKELTKYIFDKSDSITLWVIGLALGSMGILVSTLKDINKYLTTGEVKTIFLFLLISAFCGIFYRITFLYYYTLVDTAFRHIDYILSDYECMDIDGELDGSETFDDLIRLNSQYQDLSSLKEIFNSSTEEVKDKLYDDMVSFYYESTKWAKKDFDLAIKHIAQVYNDNLGIDKKYFDVNKKSSFKKIDIAKWICFILYIVFILSFLFAFAYFLTVVKVPIN
jgi:hypothetical protein